MSLRPLSIGFIPLVDAAPVIIAHEFGFAEEEGLALELQSAPSWSTLRDVLALGRIEAAHMLAPVPVAMALGLGGMATRFDVLSVLSLNGEVIGVSSALAERLRGAGHDFGFADARAAGAALIGAAGARLRVGVPFPFSMHAELLYYWLGALGLEAPQALDVRTVPPPLMAEAVAAGEIDAFCVGEPWGSIAVENGVGELLLPGSAIWAAAPDKVLAVREGWAEADEGRTGRLMRAIWRAGRWLGAPANLMTASEVLARPGYLNVPAEVIERGLTGRLVVTALGEEREAPGFTRFFDGAACFPWRSQAAWIGARLAERNGLDRAEAIGKARAVFRSDLFRAHLGPAGAEIPGASDKLEGSLDRPVVVAARSGHLILAPDAFFDGAIFDPGAER